ncbi:hypothetical protein NHH03_23980 [Stieleria sp. TO1_6]|uniref:hypothetical protein n=1 Tax=Stieleria tagensis TaxID=2956795 RepID=UPI00209AF55A|nr:hypothetical protein [Stieleria tagensis]MCO8124818.1 hypothetical protein [Stieleria tagensis]
MILRSQWKLRLASIAVVWVILSSGLSAGSAIDLLSGFDRQRIENCFPISDSTVAGEMSKLLFRLRKADPQAIAQRVTEIEIAAPPAVGDVIAVEGKITAIRQYKVPPALIEFLELETFQEVVLSGTDSDALISVFAPPLLGKIAKDDLIKANAIVVESESSQLVCAAGSLSWFPKHADRVGWQMLSSHGVDLSQIASAVSRNRHPLEAADGDAFYSMLAAAREIADGQTFAGAAPPAEPDSVSAIELLQHPESHHGDWIRMNAVTVRITRINVTDADRRQQLGQDHYYQIDASGDLGKTIVELTRPDGDGGEPIRMSGSYPLSLVSCELPDFLQQELAGQQAVVAMISHPVSLDGFFYRLWSYSSEFMTREGGGKQVGPLVVVADWRSRSRPAEAGGGLAGVGYVLAAAIVATILATFCWSRRNAKRDAQIRAAQLRSQQIDLNL